MKKLYRATGRLWFSTLGILVGGSLGLNILFGESVVTANGGGLESPLLLDSRNDIESRISLRWKILAAERALKLGLPLAAELFRELLETGVMSSNERVDLNLSLIEALVASGQFEDAADQIRALEEEGLGRSPAQEDTLRVLSAVAQYGQGNYEDARLALQSLEGAALSNEIQAWSLITFGLLEEELGYMDKAAGYFGEAQAVSPNPFQQATLNSLIQRNQLLVGELEEDTIEALENLVNEAAGTRIQAQYAEQLAIAHFREGDPGAALAALEAQILASLPGNDDQLDRLYYLIALLIPSSGGQKQTSYEWILTRGSDRAYQEMALRNLLILAEEGDREAELFVYLNDLLEQVPDHPLISEILYAQSVLAYRIEDHEVAKLALDRILSEFPGSANAVEALRFQAFLAWEEQAYRTAADIFTQLRDALPAGPERDSASVFLADCYFINGDYETAASAYAAIRSTLPDGNLKEQILYQQVLAKMNTGDLDLAIVSLNDAGLPTTELGQAFRWQAEWNLAMEMRRAGREAEAFARMDAIGESEAFNRMPPSLQLRLLWLETVLAMESGNVEQVPVLADRILAMVQSGEVPLGLEAAMVAEVEARTLFLKGQALLGLSYTDLDISGLSPEAEAGLAIFQELRDRFPGSEPADLSLFEEARYFAGLGIAVDAQQRYLELAQKQGSKFAPIALYEAAINAVNLIYLEDLDLETIDLESSEPVRLLRRLTEEYGENRELFFYARLKQGDIARDLFRFGIAQGIYESLITTFPDHPERYLAEMGRADSLSSLGSGNPNPTNLAEAVSAYESLMERSDLPIDLRAEAGNKLASALNRQGNKERAKSAYYQALTRFLLDGTVAQSLGSSGRYWLSRSALDLGQLFEEEGDLGAAAQVYQSIIEFQLPGRTLAETHLVRLGRPPATATTASTP